MKISKFAAIALVLWAVTVTVFGWMFIRGSTAPSADGRTAVVLHPGERDLVLAEMRGLLAAVQGILEGINAGKPEQVAKAASAVGMASAADTNPALMARLPLEFKSLGMSVHSDMDALALAAKSGKPPQELSAMLAATMGKCVGCHAAWRLEAKQ